VSDLLQPSPSGTWCPRGGFYIDPSRAVARAVVTHAHRDHARPGSGEYYCARSGAELLRLRVGRSPPIHAVEFGASFRLGDVGVSLHPAGHVLGSAQVRVECEREVWVVSGDYKREPDPSCEPFEVVPCGTFVTEATFARPAWRWRGGEETAREVFAWWEENRERGCVSVLYAYALGKTQRVLAELAKWTERPVFVHAEAARLVECYRRAGIQMVPTRALPRKLRGLELAGELVIAPPKLLQPSWYERFGDVDTAFASGWMQDTASTEAGDFVRGFARGFALSDHADWTDVLHTIDDTGARRVLVYHGDARELLVHLRSKGIEAASFDEDAVERT
jgi:putative mRNA 3-end processing factor